MEVLKQITNYFIPEGFSGDDDEKRRYTFLIWLGLIVGLNYTISLSMIGLIVPLTPFQKLMAAFGTFANISGPFLLRKKVPYFWTLQLVLLGNIFCFGTMMFIMGGITTTLGVWMCSFPLFALILMDWKQSVIWGAISLYSFRISNCRTHRAIYTGQPFRRCCAYCFIYHAAFFYSHHHYDLLCNRPDKERVGGATEG